MKTLTIIGAIVVSLVVASSGMASGYGWGWPCATPDLSFSGKHEQTSSAFIDKATVKKGNVTNGSQAAAVQTTSGKYEGTGAGAGATAGVGLTTVSARKDGHSASAAGLAANGAISGADAKKVDYSIKGSGAVSTVAVKGGGAAMTDSSFKYAGSHTKSGAVVGAGVTFGMSNVTTTKNTVTSAAAAGSASGVASIK